MKNWLRKNVFAICSACVAYSTVIYLGTRSRFFFGEPEFPVEE